MPSLGEGDAAKARRLDDQRLSLEAEMVEIQERLTAPGAPGLEGNLVDAEGFPRSDIDIFQVRKDRNRRAVLQTDLAALMKEIEETLAGIHKHARDTGAVHPGRSRGGQKQQSKDADDVSMIDAAEFGEKGGDGFCYVAEVQSGSPADIDGLRNGDKVLAFGRVSASAGSFEDVASVASSSVGVPVAVVVKRNDAIVTLSLTPREWNGRGILGCHLRPHG